jgi:hypothetical protein
MCWTSIADILDLSLKIGKRPVKDPPITQGGV